MAAASCCLPVRKACITVTRKVFATNERGRAENAAQARLQKERQEVRLALRELQDREYDLLSQNFRDRTAAQHQRAEEASKAYLRQREAVEHALNAFKRATEGPQLDLSTPESMLAWVTGLFPEHKYANRRSIRGRGLLSQCLARMFSGIAKKL